MAPQRRRQPLYRKYGVEAVVVVFVLVFAAAVLVPTWLLGGFEQDESLPQIRVNQTVSYDEVSMTPIKAVTATSKGKTYIGVQVLAVNKLDETIYDFNQLVVLESPIFPKPTVTKTFSYAGGRDTDNTLDPGLPRKMNLIWQVPNGTEVPDQLRVTLRKRSYVENFFAERHKWAEPEPWCQVVLPVGRG